MRKRKKGITNIEFVLALFVFLSTISFISITVIGKVPSLQQTSLQDAMKLRAYSVSNILLFDNLSSDEYYIVDRSKINSLDCDNLAEDFTDLVLTITEVDGTSVYYCKTGSPLYGFHVIRKAYDTQGEFLNIDLVIV